MFSIKEINLNQKYSTSNNNFKNFVKLLAFIEPLLNDKPVYSLDNEIFKLANLSSNDFRSFFRNNYGDLIWVKQCEKSSQKYFSNYRTKSNYYITKTEETHLNTEYLHEIRKGLIHEDRKFYETLLEKIDLIDPYSRYATKILLQLYLGDKINPFGTEAYYFINCIATNKIHLQPVLSLLSDTEFAQYCIETNYDFLSYFYFKNFFYCLTDTYFNFQLFETISAKAKEKDSYFGQLLSYAVYGISENNKNNPLIQFCEAFFKGNFEESLKLGIQIKKQLKNEHQMHNDAIPYDITFITQMCRVMLNKDGNTVKSELSSCIKKQDCYGSYFQFIANAILAIKEYKNGKKIDLNTYINSNLDDNLAITQYYQKLESIDISVITKIFLLLALECQDSKLIPQKPTKELYTNVCQRFPAIAERLKPTFSSLLGSNPTNSADISEYQDLTQSIKQNEIWKNQLDSIKDILKINKIKNSEPTKSTKIKKEKPEKKLAWIFDKNSDSPWYPHPYVINVTKDTIENPEIVNAYDINKLLNNNSAKHSYLSDQDRAIGTNYPRKRELYNYRQIYYYTFTLNETLPSMVNHPYIYLDDYGKLTHLTTEERKLSLVIKEETKDISVKLNVGQYRDSNIHMSFDEKEKKLIIYKFDKVHEQLLSILGDKGAKFPKNAIEELISLGKSSDIAISLDLKNKNTEVSSTKPIMYFATQGKKHTAKLRYQPVDDIDCPTKIPGYGESVIYYKKKNETTPTVFKRDLDEEIKVADQITQKLQSLENFYEEGSYSYSTEDLSSILNLIEEIKNSKLNCDIKWSEGKKYYVSGSISSSNFGIKADLNSNKYLTVSGNVELSDGRYITLKSLLNSLNDTVGNYIKIDDENYASITSDLRNRLEKLKALSVPGKKDELLAHPLAGNAFEGLLGDIACDFSDKIKELIAKRNEAMALTVKVPKTLNADLRTYQQEGYTWLYRLSQWKVGACLADDMGLGKTIQTITLMLKLTAKGPIIIVAPTSVCPNWEIELHKFAPTINVHRLKEADDRNNTVSSMKAGDVLIVSYGLFAIEAEILASIDWEIAVFDEAQALKNSTTQRAKSATQINARMRIALTGTPIENNLDDLWSIFNIINPGLLGTKKEFHSRFADITDNKNTARMLKLLISPFILRRLKGDVLNDLPPRTEQVIAVEGSTREKELYETLRISTLEDLETNKLPVNKNGQRRLQILTALTRLRQFCCDPALIGKELKLGNSSKTEAFLDLLDEALSGGHRLLVFSQFVGYLTIIKNLLEKKGICFQYLDGQTSEKNRAKAIEQFQLGEGDVFLISLKAGGQGLNLTGADYVVHLDPWWNPAVEDQATDRAYRIGQTRPVNVFRFVIKDSLEEKILELHAKKREIAADFLEGTSSVASEAMKLSEEELLSLIG